MVFAVHLNYMYAHRLQPLQLRDIDLISVVCTVCTCACVFAVLGQYQFVSALRLLDSIVLNIEVWVYGF